ncbi:hypothetical protein N1851_019280 [Merluccius polli]|uniref:Endonuclease/exonuclease/phosphatase domain-containing protein n=1 Tax=Merluccius polli TaxID=89951 RepID=A0AA47MMF9_MERPO|nr:hypothetical protein N1851_019280 [Merluccius polli]
MTNTPPATPEATTLRMSLFNVRSLSNKTFILNDFISSENLDLMFLTETWLQGADCNQLVELCPPHYECFNQPRVSGRGGGLVCVYKKSFKCHLLHFNGFSSFEALTFKLAGSYPILFALIYRPPKFASSFLAEFLSSLVLNFDRVVLCGDFNLHVDDPTNTQAADFLNITSSSNFQQHVHGPTHNRGHRLDLVFTLGMSLAFLDVLDFTVSDHKCIVFNSECPVSETATTRSWSTQFSAQFNLNYYPAPEPADTNSLAAHFNSVCLSTLNAIAPQKLITKSSHKRQPWLNESIRSFKRDCRKAERLWKKSGLQIHFNIMKSLLSTFNCMIKEARRQYFSNLILINQNNPRILFKTVDSLVNTPPPSVPIESDADCNRFLSYFNDKVEFIRASITPSASFTDAFTDTFSDAFYPPKDILNQFYPITLPELLDNVNLPLLLVFDSVGPNDLLLAADSGLCSVLVLLDLSVAFDTIDHMILLNRLRHWVGVSGTALKWFYSYFLNRTFCVTANNFKSSSLSEVRRASGVCFRTNPIFIIHASPGAHNTKI